MSRAGSAEGFAICIVIGAALLGFILYLNSIGTYGNLPITPTIDAFVGAIAIFVIALVVVLIARG